MKNPTFSNSPERIVSLEREALLRVVGPAQLRVVRGQVWVTLDGGPDDHVLVPGDRFVLGRSERALAQAIFGPARAVVAQEAASPAWPRRAGGALRALTRRLGEALA